MKRRLMAILLAAAMTVTAIPMSAGVFAASKDAQDAGATLQDIAQQLQDPSNDPFDYVNGGGLELDGGGYSFPNRLDLRNFEGQNYITPVKCQAPFGTCWGFAAIAAAESSILSNPELNNDGKGGQLYSTSLKQGEDGLEVLDLSEKHLAYFVTSPLNDPGNPQDGEGTYVVGGKVQDGLDNGGIPLLASNTFASGIGPNLESRDVSLEYHGGIKQKDGTIDYSNPTIVRGMVNGEWKKLTYGEEDDWSIDETWRMKQSYVLKESYMLPTPAGRDENEDYVYNPAGTQAIKEQLNQKRAVEVGFGWAEALHDESGDGTGSLPTIDYDNWAYYSPAPNGANHAVTIVGYDDKYPRENFAVQPPSDMYPDGVHEGDTNGGNGAWLVKNSWGSEEETFPNVDRGDWGLCQGQDRYPYQKVPADNDVNTGYFWLSYYDQSIDSPEAVAFDKSNVGTSYIIDEHDYMPTYMMAGADTAGEVKMANVFDAEYGEKLEQISFFTSAPNTTVRYEIYLLQDDFENPMDGTFVESGEETYQYGGFHKVTLQNQPLIARGQKYSIVINEVAESKSIINMPVGMSEEAASEWDTTWQKGIINPKESYVFMDDEWKDYSDQKLQAQLFGEDVEEATFDNFPIKGYCSQTNNDLKMSISLDQYTIDPSQGFITFCTYPGIMNKAGYMVVLRGSSDIPDGADVKWTVTNDDLFTVEPDTKDKDRVMLTVKGITGKCYLECAIDGIGSARVPLEVVDLELFRVYTQNEVYTYTGKALTPECNVDSLVGGDMEEGKQYILKFSHNTKCGKATVKAIPNEEKVSGEPEGTFIIKPAKAKVSKLAPGKKSLKVTAKNQKKSGLTGYQISYRVKGSKKWKNTTSTKNVKTIKKLKKGKTYQVRVRGYVKVGKKNYYGAWSKVSTSKKIK